MSSSLIDCVALYNHRDGRTDLALQPQRGLPVRFPPCLVAKVPTLSARSTRGRTLEDGPGRSDPGVWRVAPGVGSDARPRPPAGRSRSAVRGASTGQSDEKALLARAAAGVPASAQSATDALDELVFCGHYWRRSPGRDQAVRREPEARLMLIGRRYRLKLDFGQAAYAERTAGICRAVWNAALDQRRAASISDGNVMFRTKR